jgi:hypothetical protein
MSQEADIPHTSLGAFSTQNAAFVELIAKQVAQLIAKQRPAAETSTTASLQQQSAESHCSSAPSRKSQSVVPVERDDAIPGEWEVDTSIPSDTSEWTKDKKAALKKAIIVAWSKRQITCERPWDQNDRKKVNGAVRDVLVTCRLSKTFELFVRTTMKRKMEQKRTALARKTRAKEKDNADGKNDDDAETATASVPAAPVPRPDEPARGRERRPRGAAEEPLTRMQTSLEFRNATVGQEVEIKNMAWDTLAEGIVVMLDPSRRNPVTGVKIGDGNAAVDIKHVVGKYAKYKIPFPRDGDAGFLCDSEIVTWPIRHLSSASCIFRPIRYES